MSLEAQLQAAPPVPWDYACPLCHAALTGDEDQLWDTKGHAFSRALGIWRFLPEDRVERYTDFLREYEIVRAEEGWGASRAGYYEDLPWVARDDPQWSIWRIRAKNFEVFLRRVIAPREREAGLPLNVLDLGAGNCWLSHRLAERGHHVAAVDVSTSDSDGLGAHVWYKPHPSFIPVQAEFDRLPFAAEQMDLVVFNASLHYSTDCVGTLAEATRILRPDGRLVIMDSPLYGDPSSGAKMVSERETSFERKHGFRSDTLPSENYLTTARLDELAAAVGLRWDFIFPFHGLGWMLRPWRARLRGRREPAKHPLIVGRLMPTNAGNDRANTT